MPGPETPATAVYLNDRFGSFDRRLAFPRLFDPKTWVSWRRRLTLALRTTLRLRELGPVPLPEARVLTSARCAGYSRQKVCYETLTGNWVSAYLLIPDREGPLPAAICPHGHVPGAKENVVGLTNPVGVAYGHELASRGVVVLAPDNAGMGERDVPEVAQRRSSGCFLAWARLNQMGLDLTGLRIFDLMAGMNLLEHHDAVDAARIGCAGLSGGCWLSQVLTAMDKRVKATVLSGFFTTFVQTVWHGHCICHHPFGIGRICDMPDLSALIAPRPQFVESGISDAAYPCEPAYSMVREAYGLVGAPEALGLHRYRGGHMFNGKRSIPWLVRQLTSASC